MAGDIVASDVVSDIALVQADRTGLPAGEFRTELPRVGGQQPVPDRPDPDRRHHRPRQLGRCAAGGPGPDAGIQAGDVIVSMDDQALGSAEALLGALRGYSPGEQAEVELDRNGTAVTTTVTVVDRPVR
ncbi:PDZ domain-containing protein [Nakamurella leprariae]